MGVDPLSPVRTAKQSARLYVTGAKMADPQLILFAAKLRKTLGPVYNIGSLKDGGSDRYPAVEFLGGE